VGGARSDIIELSDYVYQRTRNRLAGLTDDEYFWEPVPGCCTIRRANSGSIAPMTQASPIRRPSPRSRGGCGTSSKTAEVNGIRSGWESRAWRIREG
jgi:hypothetical protein